MMETLDASPVGAPTIHGGGMPPEKRPGLTDHADAIHVLIAIILLVIAGFQLWIALSQKKIAATQQNVDLLLFVRENINGYLYLYDMVEAAEAVAVVEMIRDAGLSAIAVPSQFFPDRWLIVTHSFGNFSSEEEAEEQIIEKWQKKFKRFPQEKYRKMGQIIEVMEQRLRGRGYDKSLYFYYRADIVTHRKYFRRLARSEDFLVSP